MNKIRHQIVRIAGGWLALQLCLVSAAPVVLWASLSSGAATVECTCSHGDGVECPMHHATAKGGSKSCSCRSTADDSLAVIASLFGETAVLTTPTQATEPSFSAQLPRGSRSHPLDLFLVPDAPPPRA